MSLVVFPKTVVLEPTVPELDTLGIAEHLTSVMSHGVAYTMVFLGCGCAIHEVAVCKALLSKEYKIEQEIFMDKFVCSNAIATIEDYVGIHSNSKWTTHAVFDAACMLLALGQSHLLKIYRHYRNAAPPDKRSSHGRTWRASSRNCSCWNPPSSQSTTTAYCGAIAPTTSTPLEISLNPYQHCRISLIWDSEKSYMSRNWFSWGVYQWEALAKITSKNT